jgi:hypothetical protein
MSFILDFKNWSRVFENDAEQGATGFVYSENSDPTEREIENSKNMQQYLVNMFGGKNTLDGTIGKTVYLYSKPAILKENEFMKFTIAGTYVKDNPTSNVKNAYLYSDAIKKVQAPYIRVSNVYNVQTIEYHKNNMDGGTQTYNEPLLNAIRALMGGKPYTLIADSDKI